MTVDPSTVSPDEALLLSACVVAQRLFEGTVGGGCYHGPKHGCFVRQGRRPLALYKAEEMCERCQATWHALMTTQLLDSLMISQGFLGQTSPVTGVEPPTSWTCTKCSRRFKRKNNLTMHEKYCKGTGA